METKTKPRFCPFCGNKLLFVFQNNIKGLNFNIYGAFCSTRNCYLDNEIPIPVKYENKRQLIVTPKINIEATK